jgi:hypothetical protein
MRQISRSWAAKLPALPSFTYGFKIRLLLLLGPASIEFRVLAFWNRAGFSHIHQRGSLNTLSQHQGTSRSKSGKLIEELSIDARDDLPEIAQIFRIL